MPEVTVLMPVRNGEKYIREAIDSVLKQSFTDFELLIMDDGSTDGTVDIISAYEDTRIRLESRSHDFLKTLNEGLMLASGPYIARMDADDIMHTERLRIQLKRMKKNPDITVCGTWAKIFSDDGKVKSSSRAGYGIVSDPILQLLNCNMLLHPTVMLKKDFLISHRIDYRNYRRVEDYNLWFEIAKEGGVLFIEPQELLMYRKSDTQVTVLKKDEMHSESIRLRKDILRYLLSLHGNKTLDDLLLNFEDLETNKWMSSEEIFRFFVNLLSKMQ